MIFSFKNLEKIKILSGIFLIVLVFFTSKIKIENFSDTSLIKFNTSLSLNSSRKNDYQEDYQTEEFKECRFDPVENSTRWRAWSEIKVILKFFDVVAFPSTSWNIKPFHVSNGAPSIPESPSFSPGIVLNRRQTTFLQKLISILWRIYGLD